MRTTLRGLFLLLAMAAGVIFVVSSGAQPHQIEFWWPTGFAVACLAFSLFWLGIKGETVGFIEVIGWILLVITILPVVGQWFDFISFIGMSLLR